MSECKVFNEHGNHNFDWDESQVCPDCGIKEVDFYEKELTNLKGREKKLLELVLDLSKVRLYNSANIFKGPMIRDKGMVHDVVMRAREVLKQVEELKGEK